MLELTDRLDDVVEQGLHALENLLLGLLLLLSFLLVLFFLGVLPLGLLRLLLLIIAGGCGGNTRRLLRSFHYRLLRSFFGGRCDLRSGLRGRRLQLARRHLF